MLFRKTLIPTIRKVIGDSVLRRGFKRKSLYKESKLHEAKKKPQISRLQVRGAYGSKLTAL